MSLKRKIFVLSFAALATIQVTACGRNTVPSDSTATTAPKGNMEEDILFYVNKYRKSKNLGPLELSETVSQQAREHSKNMAKGRTGFGHQGFEERVDDISKKMGTVRAAAENVAYGNLDAQAVVKGWINSPGHRKNLEGNYNLIGIGTADKGNITFFTQIFINKPAAAAPASKK
ncbi:CAP domain-containing protein [uncultured Chitinophaga sp.]|uniref:CAP domain-containing protein n=1 Tax=uncultured Chitinophaga sp. TaxID=339340 RepID=UPI0025CB921A|nr:CAP domain-containing protein [uncultured Chitinophaga sp.]